MTGFGHPNRAPWIASLIVLALVGLNIVSFVSSVVYGESPTSEGVDPAVFSQAAQPVVENVGEMALMVFGATVVITLLPSVEKAARVGIRRVLSAREYPWDAVGQYRRIEHFDVDGTETCVNCGQEFAGGVVHEYRTDQVVFGFPIQTVESGSVPECSLCQESEVVDYGLRAGKHDEHTGQAEVAQ